MKEISYLCEGCGKKRRFTVSDEDKTKLKNKKSCVQCRKLKRINRERNRRGKKRISAVEQE